MSTSEEKLLHGYSGRLFIVTSVGTTVIRINRRLVPPLLPLLIEEFSLSSTDAGVLVAIIFIGFALFQFPGGNISDQLSRTIVLLPSLLMMAIGSFLILYSNNYIYFILGLATAGVAEGLYGAANKGLLSDLFIEKRGAAFGIQGMCTEFGSIVATVLGTVAIIIGNWRLVFIAPLILSISVMVSLYNTSKDTTTVNPISINLLNTARNILWSDKIRLIILIYSIYIFVVQGFVSFLPVVLISSKGFTPGLANATYGVIFAVGVISRPIAGTLSDKFTSRLPVAAIAIFIGAIGIIIFIVGSNIVIIIIGVLLFATGRASYSPVMMAYMMDSFADKSMAGDLGASRFIYLGIGSFGSVFVGIMADKFSYLVSYSTFILAFLIAGLALSRLMTIE